MKPDGVRREANAEERDGGGGRWLAFATTEGHSFKKKEKGTSRGGGGARVKGEQIIDNKCDFQGPKRVCLVAPKFKSGRAEARMAGCYLFSFFFSL